MTVEEHILKIRTVMFCFVVQGSDDVLRGLAIDREASPYLRNMAIKTLLARMQVRKALLARE